MQFNEIINMVRLDRLGYLTPLLKDINQVPLQSRGCTSVCYLDLSCKPRRDLVLHEMLISTLGIIMVTIHTEVMDPHSISGTYSMFLKCCAWFVVDHLHVYSHASYRRILCRV